MPQHDGTSDHDPFAPLPTGAPPPGSQDEVTGDLDFDPRSADRAALARMMGLDSSLDELYRPDELEQVARHQMRARMVPELSRVLGVPTDDLRALFEPIAPPMETFADLVAHPSPPVAVLKLVKKFAKVARKTPDSPIPHEVGALLYHLCVAMALIHHNKWTSTQDRDTVAGWLRSFLATSWWLDPASRAVLDKGLQQMTESEI